MSESKWQLSKVLREGELKASKKIAHKMFLDGENIIKIRRYSDLPDEDLAEVLINLPKDIQTKYS